MQLPEEILKIGEAEGIPLATVYELAAQFMAVYPDEWQGLLKDRLHADGKDRARNVRIGEKQRTIQRLRSDLATAKHEDLEPTLDEEIKKMEGELEVLAEKRAERNSKKVAAAKAAAGGGGGEE